MRELTHADSFGPIGVSVTDVAILHHALLAQPSSSISLSPTALQGTRIGVPRRVFRDHTKVGADARTAPTPVAAEYEAALDRTICLLRGLGATVIEDTDLDLDDWLAIAQADRDALSQADFAEALPKWISTLEVNPNEIKTASDLFASPSGSQTETTPNRWTCASAVLRSR